MTKSDPYKAVSASEGHTVVRRNYQRNKSAQVKKPCPFDKLFTRSVPHIHEKIFFALDYKSFNKCQKVCSAWKELLNSEPFKQKANSVYLYKMKQKRYILTTDKEERKNNRKELWRFSRDGWAEEVQDLLSLGVDPNCKSRETHKTPLFLAAANGFENVVELLLKAGANPNHAELCGQTPLLRAANDCLTDVVKILLEGGADPNKADTSGYTPLLWAVIHGHTDVVKILLEGGAEPNTADIDGNTALFRAITKGQTDVVKLLLKAGADLNWGNEFGTTPLDCAARSINRW